MKKLTPIGYSDFKQIQEENRYYVDKTGLVAPVINGASVLLLCRPRRFGKTLNLSMLRYFFDCTEDCRHLFEGLAVEQDAEAMRHLGQYPVITLSFKNIRGVNFEGAMEDIFVLLVEEWERHEALRGNPDYDEALAGMKATLKTGKPRAALFVHSIQKLSKHLSQHFSAQVVILIDEYDTPIQNAWLRGYYDLMVDFLRKLLGSCLKDNTYLKKGVLTGILRVAKESLFSDLNNFKSSAGILPDPYSDKFGFTEPEVMAMLRHYDLNGREMDDIRSWYDGYRFGEVVIYNPWSIIFYVDSEDHTLRPYWVNTSGNELLKRLFFGKSANISPYLDTLMRGEKVKLRLSEFLVFQELESTEMAIFNMLFFAGYLRAENPTQDGDYFDYQLSIPNREVRTAYTESVNSWLRTDLGEDIKEPMLHALLTGDVPTFEDYLSNFVVRVVSFYDAPKNRPEHFYHAFLLGLLVRLDGRYRIRSNVESGFGRYDICLIPNDISKKGVIMEIKAPNLRRNETLESALQTALEQISRNKYDTELAGLGVSEVLRLAIAVSGKELKVQEG